ncbi:MAG TPA: hypothetical protein VK628_01560 [Flavitalea sp.]|nr:hypothetical protein [Flavitalea sp.]
MTLQQRVVLLERLGNYLAAKNDSWEKIKSKAAYENAWFIPEFINYQLSQIATSYLAPDALRNWVAEYNLPEVNPSPKLVGLVMAGNIPLAGFHDLLSTFIAGHRMLIKTSSKDGVLIPALIDVLNSLDPASGPYFSIAPRLTGCDAYIATGSNNSSRYFEYYFGRYPHIIRRNRTSVAVLTGNETIEDLTSLADDVFLYFGLGCRNVTKLLVPPGYEFFSLLESFKKYDYLSDHNKYRNNYDYQLAVLQINRVYYMTNGSIILQENKSVFSPVSQLHFEYCPDPASEASQLASGSEIQCVVGKGFIPFGKAQQPTLNEYADQADTLKFLLAP